MSTTSFRHGEISELTELLDEQSNGGSRQETVNASSYLRVACTTYASAFRFIQSTSQDYVKQKSYKGTGCSSLHTVVNVEPDDNDFKIDQVTLNQLTNDKDHALLKDLGGVVGIAKALRSDIVNGIHDVEEDIALRRKVFCANTLGNPPRKTFFHFIRRALLDFKIFILIICGSVSLGIGIQLHGKDCLDTAVSVLGGVFLAVIFFAISDYWHDRVFDKLREDSFKVKIEVVRGGCRQQIPVLDILVGDVVRLSYGDKVPANGLLIKSYSLKLQGNKVCCPKRDIGNHLELDPLNNDIFLFSGSKVVDGFAWMIVTSVGINTRQEQISHRWTEIRPLYTRLKELASSLDCVNHIFCSIFILLGVLGRLNLTVTDKNGVEKKATGLAKVMVMLDIVVTLTISVVNIANPFGLTLTLTRAYAMKKLKAQNAMVRKLSALEIINFVDTICVNETGTLTMNQMKISKFWLGNDFVAEEKYSSIAPKIKRLLQEGIALNTPSISTIETTILSWGMKYLEMDTDDIKTNLDILHIEGFSPEKKQSWIIAQRKADKTIQVHLKGAARLILESCSCFYHAFGMVRDLDHNQKMKLEKMIQCMAASKLRCIAFAHKEVETEDLQDDAKEKMLQHEMILLAIVGIGDPCRPNLRHVVKDLHIAGVKLKMFTGDNVFVAKAIAEECGILEYHGGEIIEAEKFRSYSAKERRDKANEICVMANSSPEDKRLMVECLKDRGNVVGVIAHGTNNSSAMREADIGVYMGKEGTEIIEEHSDIVILDSNFCSITKLLKWGRCVYSNLQKFIQFHVTVVFASLLSNICGLVVDQELTLSAIMLLWMNLINETLACLAYATENPTKELIKKPPVRHVEPLVTNIMVRNILPQALFQATVLLKIADWKLISKVDDEMVPVTFVFNLYVFCQVFNQINARKLETKNVLEKIQANKLFLVTAGFIIVLQVFIVEILKLIAETRKLNWSQWSACVGIASLTLPIGWIVRFIPVPETQVMNYLLFRVTGRFILKKLAYVVTWATEVLISMYKKQNATTDRRGEKASPK